jgi:hypothetical protein
MRQKQIRTTLLGLLTGGALLACGSAWGGPLPAPATAPCVAGMTVTAFAALGAAGCSVTDKNYTFVSDLNVGADTITINVLTLGSGDVQHNFGVTFGSGISGTFAGSLDYTVVMNDLAVGFAGIDSVTFDTTTGGPSQPLVLAQSNITPNNATPVITLNSINGSSQGANTVNEPQGLAYDDTWAVSANGSLFSSADTLIETKIANVPEPASLALVGLGLSALGFMRRRKQQG